VTLNDSVYVEAARYLAFRMMDAAGGGAVGGGGAVAREDAVIDKGYELLMFKPLEARKLEILKKLYDVAYAKFSKDDYTTCEMVGAPGVHDNPETAAYVVVAEALLNLDEVITKS
jgi:hypothetical protein